MWKLRAAIRCHSGQANLAEADREALNRLLAVDRDGDGSGPIHGQDIAVGIEILAICRHRHLQGTGLTRRGADDPEFQRHRGPDGMTTRRGLFP